MLNSRNIPTPTRSRGHDERNSCLFLGLNIGDAQILQDVERHVELLKKFKPGCFKYMGSGSEATWNLEKCGGGIPQGNGMRLLWDFSADISIVSNQF